MNSPHAHARPKKRNTLPRTFYRWHRRIGVTAALFLIWIVISGWLLNHSDSLNLAQHQIHSSALAKWYKLDTSLPSHVLSTSQHWLVNLNGENFLDGTKINVPLHNVIGFAQSEHILALANEHQLILLNDAGALIDQISSSNLPVSSISKIGAGCSGFVIGNMEKIVVSQDGIDWQDCSQTVLWSTSQPISPLQRKSIEAQLTPEISLEKIIVDLHTGRFFGRYGAYVVDGVGGCLLLLALSGLWLFFRMGHKK